MIKILQKIRTQTLLLLFLEILLIVSGIVMYHYDFLGFRSVLSFAVMIVFLVSIMVINIFFLLNALARMLKNRQQKDLQTADLLGSDIPEAYRFAGLGIIVIDDDFQIVWVNEVIQDMNDRLIETNIFEWRKELEDLYTNASTEAMIDVAGKTFFVKYLRQSRMFILKDVSEYEDLLKVYQDESIVVGVVVLDNYEENAPAFDEQSDYISLIRTKVVSYFGDLGFVIQKIRSDSYYIIGTMVALDKFRKDKFKIIETIYQLEKNQSRLITLSIGIAYGVNEDIKKLNSMAFEAVELAVARGGNQGIIDDHNKKENFGGYHLTKGNEMKVDLRIQERNDNILRAIQQAKNIYIVGHKDTDMDALGACLAVKALGDHFKKPTKIILDYPDTEKRTRAAVSSLFTAEENKLTFIQSEKAINIIDEKDLLVVLDVNNPDLVVGNSILFKKIPTIVIDHHKRTDLTITSTLYDPLIDTSASSTTELIVDIIMHNRFVKAKDLNLSETTATIMLSGIYLDTNFFRLKSVGPRTFEASRYLIEKGAETTHAHDLLKEDFSELLIINRVTASAETIETGVLLTSFLEDDPVVESALISKISNAMMDMRGVNVAFVVGKIKADGTLKVSARSDGSINVALIMEKLGGGGHHTMAAMETTTVMSMDALKTLIKETTREYFSSAKEMQGVK
jgi:c-di-AMP phosphodiesterase-like protein